MARVALIYDHLTRPETTGIYCLRALSETVQVEQFHPSQSSEIPRNGYELYLFIDDGLAYGLPGELRPRF